MKKLDYMLKLNVKFNHKIPPGSALEIVNF